MRIRLAAGLLGAVVVLASCGGGSVVAPPAGNGNGGPPSSIAWGPRLGESDLSAFAGAED